MGGGVFDPGGTGVDQAGAPAPAGTLPGAPSNAATYVKIVVPNFNGAGANKPQMASYLRLGAPEPDVIPGVVNTALAVNGIDPTGEDLASVVTSFTDDLRIRNAGDVSELQTALKNVKSALQSAQQQLTMAKAVMPQTFQSGKQVLFWTSQVNQLINLTTALAGALGAASQAELDGLSNALANMQAPQPNLPAQQTLPFGTTASATGIVSELGLAIDQPTTNPLPGTFANRLAETAVLHTKGGWRDHTDGNRITTTRGDKVEVIRGNYRMVILGRQDLNPLVPGSPFDLEDWATGLDESGGLADNQDQARGTSGVLAMTYNWEPDSDGRWGWTQATTTGAFDDTATSPTGKTTQGNGRQISFAWVDQIMNITGGPNNLNADKSRAVLPTDPDYDGRYENNAPGPMKRVDKMYSRTWANSIDGMTDASGDIVSVTRAHDLKEQFYLEGGHHTLETCADHTEETYSRGKRTEVKSAFGLVGEIDMAILAVAELKMALLIPEFKLGIHIDTHIGPHLDFHLLPHMEMHLMPHFDLHTVAGKSRDISMTCSQFGAVLSSALLFGAGAPPADPEPPPAAAAAGAGAAPTGAATGAATGATTAATGATTTACAPAAGAAMDPSMFEPPLGEINGLQLSGVGEGGGGPANVIPGDLPTK
jgi:hypothetical protein